MNVAKPDISNLLQFALQLPLRPAPSPVFRNKDYADHKRLLESVDALARTAFLDALAVEHVLEGCEGLSLAARNRKVAEAEKALRVMVLRQLLGNPSLRAFSKALADSELYSDFCRVRQIDGVRKTSKSGIHRLGQMLPESVVLALHKCFLEVVCHTERAGLVGLQEAQSLKTCLIDSTCLETNIHYPTDWVLLRDVCRTLLKAIKLIRKQGLLCRMPEEPESFAKTMNRLCMQMTHSRRRSDGAKARKKTLRRMKHLLRTIGEHARRHRDLLESDFEKTQLSVRESGQILARIDRMLEVLPEVIWQAHERIIGEREVPAERKRLSVYEPEVKVIVRGKAGGEVEFGNTLTLSENATGLITDFKLHRGNAGAEWRQCRESLQRQERYDVDTPIEEVVGDRGFFAGKLKAHLKKEHLFDATCPRDPKELGERMKNSHFAKLQKRRSETEARIGILKQRLGRKLRCKGFEKRSETVAWAVLTHNLWKIAGILEAQERKAAKAA